MATQRERTDREKELDRIDVVDREHWEQGPPHEIFRDLRQGCPVHWSEINEYPDEEGFWSVTRADDVRDAAGAPSELRSGTAVGTGPGAGAAGPPSRHLSSLALFRGPHDVAAPAAASYAAGAG